MKFINGLLSLSIERVQSSIDFTVALAFAEEADNYADGCTVDWRIRAGRQLVRSRSGHSIGPEHHWNLKAAENSPAWVLVTVKQPGSEIEESHGWSLEAHSNYATAQRKLCPLPDAARALSYIASHGDLISEIGANPTAGREHYMAHGSIEGRGIAFSPNEYAASYEDTMQLVGNPELAARHYIEHGRSEGRVTYFNAVKYAAGYPDVAAAYGSDVQNISLHFARHGRGEGRHCDNFDWQEYARLNAQVFHSEYDAAINYIEKIYNENCEKAPK